MPRSPQAHDHAREPSELSDQDVELLHQIILRAQQRHDVQKRPKRALFEAYEKVFAEHGLDTRQDRACLRIVLQLGEPQIPGDLLYDKFEYVLRQMGVNLAFRDDEPPINNEHEDATEWNPDEHTTANAMLLQPTPMRPKRRASWTSMHDVSTERIRRTRPQRQYRASESRLQNERPPRPLLQQENLPPNVFPEAKSIQQRRFSHESQGSKGNGINDVYSEHLVASKYQSPKYKTSESGVEGRLSEGFRQDVFSTDDESEIAPRKVDNRDSSYQLTPTDLYRDAEVFEDVRLRNVQRNFLSRWARMTRERSEHIQALEQQAVGKDCFTLKRQALDFWRVAYHEKRKRVLEERFFEHLHIRAGRAYDLHLLTKSFTHWIQITSATVAETNAARQRFLFTKYFHPWYQLTATNEIKIERHALKAPLNLLKKRAAQYFRDQINALEVYHGNLTRYVFWRWFREWCDRAAPRYSAQQLQRRIFGKWLQVTRRYRSLQVGADSGFAHRSLQNVFQSWATKARIDVAGCHQADAFKRSHLLQNHLIKWRAEAKLKTLAGQISRMRDWRIARSMFSIWQLRTRMVFRADAVNTMRTLQNAYTAWNEKLRTQALAARLTERIVAEALYKWVIAQRFVLMTRISEHHRKTVAVQAFLDRIRAKCNILVLKEAQWVALREQQLLGVTFSNWRNKMVASRARSQMALGFYNPKLKQDTVEAIRLKLQLMQRLEMWAKDARFYFLMTRHVAIWHAASTQQRRVRERAAHAKMRRKCKMNLARNLLYRWSEKRSEHLGACERADKVYIEKIRALQHLLFRGWQTRASQWKQEANQISARYDEHLLDHFLGLLVNMSRHLYSLQSRADQFRQLRISEICSAQLRRLSMRAFEMRRREQDADAMHHRQGNKHIRNMLRHWASKAQDSVYRDLVVPKEKPQEQEPTDAGYGTASNEDHGQSTNGNDLGATSRAEEWTAFDGDLLEGSEWNPTLDDVPIATSTPMHAPAYLNTPSKRAARAKALASYSTTPATPLRTPFAARLRAGMGSSPSRLRATTARKGGIGYKSTLGLNVGASEGDD